VQNVADLWSVKRQVKGVFGGKEAGKEGGYLFRPNRPRDGGVVAESVPAPFDDDI
jgi:hypothetical protein